MKTNVGTCVHAFVCHAFPVNTAKHATSKKLRPIAVLDMHN